jgi:glycosyltransferase involved in cell wall biosynthesis
MRTAEEFEVIPPVGEHPLPELKAAEKIRRALDPTRLDVHGCSASRSDRERILSALPDYDLIWLMNSRTPNILQIWRWAGAHLDIDDIPSAYFRTAARVGPSLMARLRARAQEAMARRREKLLGWRFETLSVCSDEDRAYLRGDNRVHVIPNGFPAPETSPVRSPSIRPVRIGFIGLYTYGPNLEGVRWFLRECWPTLRERIPGVRFRLVGKGTDGPLRPSETDVNPFGWMADPSAEIATWSLMVIPILTGAGTRMKLVDAFSRRCPVVSTGLGAYGYGLEDGKQLRIADTPAGFAGACVELVKNPVEAAAIAGRAWEEFLERWTWEAIAPRVEAAVADCLGGTSSGRSPPSSASSKSHIPL